MIPTDPAYLAHLETFAGEIGAQVIIIREPEVARLLLRFNGELTGLDLANWDNPAGLLVVLRFVASDGGEAGVEVCK